MRILHFFLSHSIFIAFCAVALCFQTNVLLGIPLNYNLLLFIFFSTICSYNFYWLVSKFYFSKRIFDVTFLKLNGSFFLLFIVTAIFSLLLFFRLQCLFWYISFSIALTFLYVLPLLPFKAIKPLQQLGFLKTILLSFAWAFTTTFLPAASFIKIYLPAALLIFLSRFCFMLLLCIIFDRRDAVLDEIKGLHSIATDTSEKKLFLIVLTVYLCFITYSLIFCYYFSNVFQASAFILSGLLFWIVYKLSNKKQGYVFYYFVVDGLMLATALLSFFASSIS